MSSVAELMGLDVLVREHFESLEADFQAHYGIDLREALWGEHYIGCRRLLSLIRGLPDGSAVHRAADPEGHGWGTTEELLAAAVELIDFSNRLFIAAYSKPGKPVPKPITINRPGQKPPQTNAPRRQSTPAELKKALGSMIKVTPKEPDGTSTTERD